MQGKLHEQQLASIITETDANPCLVFNFLVGEQYN
jgi:hypothetical protein